MFRLLRHLLILAVVGSFAGAIASAQARPGDGPRVSAKSSKAAARQAKSSRHLRAQKLAALRKASLPARADRDGNDGNNDATPALYSSAALVLDQKTGEVLYEKNSSAVVPIASITKLMTAMVVLDAALDLKEEIVITREDIDLLKGSQSRLPIKARVTREEALLMALMASENRAAHALGRTYPGGLDAFVKAMNEKAVALGMEDSSFADPTGLSSRNVSTARDLGRMVVAAHAYPLIRELTTTASAKVDVGRYPVGYNNTNPLVKNANWSIGLSKTGYIAEAGKCLVMQAWVAGRPTVMVLLDSWGKLTRVADAIRVRRWLENTQAHATGATPNA